MRPLIAVGGVGTIKSCFPDDRCIGVGGQTDLVGLIDPGRCLSPLLHGSVELCSMT